MPDQFTVPQFIDVEDKIVGPLSARQFLILLAVGLLDALLYKLMLFWKFILIGIPIFIIGFVFAFIRVNGQPFHFFVLNMIQTFSRPLLRVWDKRLTSKEIKAFLRAKTVPPPPAAPSKAPLTVSRLRELSLIVNTGGAYEPEDGPLV